MDSPPPDRLGLLRAMMLIRAFEAALAARPDRGFQLLSSGEEAVAVGLCAALGPDDLLLSSGRSIGPALARGEIVLCDRFADSTRAYQGAAGGADPDFIQALEQAVLGETRPGLTLILDAPANLGLARAAERGGAEARFEAKGLAFHERLREGFLSLARSEPERCRVIGADQSVEAVEIAIWSAVSRHLGLSA